MVKTYIIWGVANILAIINILIVKYPKGHWPNHAIRPANNVTMRKVV